MLAILVVAASLSFVDHEIQSLLVELAKRDLPTRRFRGELPCTSVALGAGLPIALLVRF
jgi:hypothetical protein